MNNIILILIIIAYLIYKIADRICDTFDMQKDSEEYKIMKTLIVENEKLTEKLLEKDSKTIKEE